ncbi:hypothetical protein J1792_32725 [Streptomyces triculaminicus]|uniref:Uncharacterized protein n=1 Tax=Streptomyces triculaminicus TaxID=2816232 RepID=A0A939FVD2_9ACTN|nr:hypothetical protein [Streptomyces triculaminicus]MBO0657306.1 hypothetical protein [Streptomyces triculaminicus]
MTHHQPSSPARPGGAINGVRSGPEAGQAPAYMLTSRRLAIIGLILFMPVFLLQSVVMAGMQMATGSCYYDRCSGPLMEAIGWCWPVMWAAGGTGLVAALAPNRFATARCAMTCFQYALMVAPFILLANARPGP